MPKTELTEMTEEMVDQMHGQALDTLKQHVETLMEALRCLNARYVAVGSGGVKTYSGIERYKHAELAIVDLQRMLAKLDFAALAAAVALMTIVDATCENWEREAAEARKGENHGS